MSFLSITSAIVLILMTLIPLSTRRDWWIRAMDFPSLQIVILSLAWLLLWLGDSTGSGFFASVLAIAVFGVLIYQCIRIYPYTEIHTLEVDSYLPEVDGDTPTLKIVSCNVLMSNRDSSKILSLIKQHQPDVFISLESDDWWEQQFDGLADYPHTLKCPQDNLYGMHIYSRYPLNDASINYEAEENKPSMNTRIDIDSETFVNLFVAHPAPPAPMENAASAAGEVALIKLAEHVATSNDRVIVAGDFNDVAWSATARLFKQISGLLDPRIGRGLFNTFNAFHWFARWPLDHVFLSNHFKVKDIQRLPAIGSDHFPLMLELAIMQNTSDEIFVESNSSD